MIEVDKESSLLVGDWFETSAKLQQEGVKKQIAKILKKGLASDSGYGEPAWASCCWT